MNGGEVNESFSSSGNGIIIFEKILQSSSMPGVVGRQNVQFGWFLTIWVEKSEGAGGHFSTDNFSGTGKHFLNPFFSSMSHIS